MQLDLNKAFPAAADGSHGPLPKQQDFLNCALNPEGPKYTGYVGGIGSGKTLIGCITVLTWAVQHGGDYLIGRQFFPELRDTTYKTFKEICPPELIVEDRIADMIIKVKSLNGIATIFFRALEEPDKLRSLNLSGFLIDEANQVADYAFELLQGRLRNHKGLRKGIVVSNPAGHNWLYQWFVKKDFMAEEARADYGLIMAPSTENIHLPDGYVQSMLSTWSEQRIQREIYGSFDAFEGQIYTQFRRDVHVVQPFKIPDSWTRVIGADHGYRNPACWIWGAVDHDGNLWIYKEFYQSEWSIEEIIKGNSKEPDTPGIIEMCKGEKIDSAWIDPSIKDIPGSNRKKLSEWQEYFEYLPKNFPLAKANNQVEGGIERVRSWLTVREDTGKPRMHIFNNCEHLLSELTKYKYKELRPSQVGKINMKEEPAKVDDHACDALRYLVMSRPDPAPRPKDKDKPRTGEYYLQQSIKELKNPKQKCPWGDY